LPGIDLKFVVVADPTREVALGERGEICIKGPNVMKGYWKNPEATAAAMTADGYLRTGDVATMDEDGYVTIVDRIKDMLIVGGFNVYPRNIEEAIYQHPAVEEAGVIGVPDAYRGEKPKAFVKLKTGSPTLTLDEMKAFLKDRLARHEMIGELELRDELPKTGAGKISKKDLREIEERRRAG
jgi:long-chain acyl-CoA synthetase